MKKLLALVLALVMTLGLATVGANAAYADAADINYKEAVDVMTAIGVLGGDESGFRPADTLKRSEGAKIIAYLLLGNKAAEALSGTGSKFTDVPANHWAAGYIEYLTAVGVLGGVGDNKFDPDGDLTTTQFAKMLLVALGYDAQIEGFVGTDWAINTQKIANQISLFSGNSDASGSAAITREEAALYSLNTLTSSLVEYETKGTTLEVNGAKITTGASNAKPVTNRELGRQTIYDNTVNSTNVTTVGVTIAGAYVTEFAEQYYPKLVLADNGDSTDDFGRPANKWSFEGKSVGTYNDKEDLKYTAPVSIGTIYKDLGLTGSKYVTTDGTSTIGADVRSLFFIDGKNVRVDGTTQTVDNEGRYSVNTTPLTAAMLLQITKNDSTEIGGYGVDTYVYYDTTTGGIRIAEVNWYAGEVTGVYPATSTKAAYIDVSPANSAVSSRGTKETTAFALSDIVVYTQTYGGSIKDVQKAETVEGTMSTYTGTAAKGGSLTVDGTKYTDSKNIANAASSEILKNNVKVSVVLDKYGYAIDIDDEIVLNYGVIIDKGIGVGSLGRDNAVELLLTDGTKSGVVTLDGDYHTNDGTDPVYGTAITDTAMQIGDIVSFTVSTGNKYHLTLRAASSSYAELTGKDTEIITNGAGTMQFGAGAAKRADGKTVFLVRDSSKNYHSYIGVKSVPTVIALAGKTVPYAVSYAEPGKAAATVVYVYAESGKGLVKSNENIFVAVKDDIDESKDATLGSYYEFPAYVNGEPTMLKVGSTAGAAMEAVAPTFKMYNSVSYNSNNIATLGTEIPAVTGTATEKNNVVKINGVAYTSTDSTKVFFINSNNEITSSSVKGIPNDDTTVVWFDTNSSNELTYVFWKAAPDTYTFTTATVTYNVGYSVANAETGSYATVVASATNANGADTTYTLNGTALTGGTGGAAATLATAIKGIFDTAAAKELPVTVTVNGDLVLDDATHITLGAGSTLIVNGNLWLDNGGKTTPLLTVGKDAKVEVRGSDAKSTNGVLNVNAGLLTIDGGTVSASKAIVIDYASSGNGHVNVDGTLLTTNATGTTTIGGDSLVIAGGSVEFAGKVVVTGTLTVTGGALTISGVTDVDSTGTVTISSGEIQLAKVEVDSGANVAFTGNATVKTGVIDTDAVITVAGSANVAMAEVTSTGSNGGVANTSTGTVTAASIDASAAAKTSGVTNGDNKITLTIAKLTANSGSSASDTAAPKIEAANLKIWTAGLSVTTGSQPVQQEEGTIGYKAYDAGDRTSKAYAVAGDTVLITFTISVNNSGKDGTALPDTAGDFVLDDDTKKLGYTVKSAEKNSQDSKKTDVVVEYYVPKAN